MKIRTLRRRKFRDRKQRLGQRFRSQLRCEPLEERALLSGVALQEVLSASNAGLDDRFGTAVAVDGDVMVVGAATEDSAATGINGDESDNSASSAGAAYVFRDGDGDGDWSDAVQDAYLKASNTDSWDEFGDSVAVSGQKIVVGAKGDEEPGLPGDTGTAVIFGSATNETSNRLHWQGDVSTSWSDPGNWLEGRTPIDGDTLVFNTDTSGFAGFSSVNDLTGLSLKSLEISDTSSAGDFFIGGDSVTLASGISIDGGTNDSLRVGFTSIALAAPQSFTNETILTSFTSDILLGANDLALAGARGQFHSGQISGSGDVTVSGPGAFNAANTYTGLTKVTSVLLLQQNGTLGDTTSGTIVENGTLDLSTGVTNAEQLSLQGSFASIRGRDTSVQSGDIALDTSRETSILWNTSAGGTFTVSGDITGNAGTDGMRISPGATDRTIVLSGNNAYDGKTRIHGTGTAQLGDFNVLPDNTAVIVGVGSTLDLATFGDRIGSLAGSGDVLLGSAPLQLGADNSSTTFSGTIQRTGQLIKEGDGTFTLDGTINDGGNLTLNGGELQLGGPDRISDGRFVSIGNNASLNLNSFDQTVGGLSGNATSSVDLGSGTLTTGNLGINTSFFGSITGGGGLVKEGAGTLSLAGTNAYTGATNIAAGALRVTHPDALGGTTGGTIVEDGHLLVDVTLPEPVDVQAAGAVVLSDDAQLDGPVQLGGRLNGRVGSVVNGDVTLTGTNARLAMLSSPGTFTINGSLTDGGAGYGIELLTTSSSAEIALNNPANDYGGSTSVTGTGRVWIGNPGVIPVTSPVTLGTSATIDLADHNEVVGSLAGSGTVLLGSGTLTTGGNNTTTTFAGVINGKGQLSKFGTGTLTLSGVNTFTSAAVVDGTLLLENADALANNADVTVHPDGTLDLAGFDETIGALSGSGVVALEDATLTTGGIQSARTFAGDLLGGGTSEVIKIGTGTWTLTGRTVALHTTVEEGTVAIGDSGGVLSDSGLVTVSAGATFDLDNHDEAVLALAGEGDVTLGSGTLTVSFFGSMSFDGVISGTGGLTKQKPGTFALSGSNTYSGETRVEEGTLEVRHSNALGSTSAGTIVADGAALEIDGRNGDVHVGPESLHLLGSGIDGDGALRSVSGANTWSGDVTLASTGLLVTTIGVDSGELLLDGIVSDTGGQTLHKPGAGQLALAGANTYSGTTNITAGTLLLLPSGDISSSHKVHVASGAAAIIEGTAGNDTLEFNDTGSAGVVDVFLNDTYRGTFDAAGQLRG